MKKNIAIHVTFDAVSKKKLIYIAKKDSRRLANYISYILYQEIMKYEKENGEISLPE